MERMASSSPSSPQLIDLLNMSVTVSVQWNPPRYWIVWLFQRSCSPSPCACLVSFLLEPLFFFGPCLLRRKPPRSPPSGARGVPLPHSHGAPVITSCRRLLSCAPRRRAKRGSRSPLATRNLAPWTHEGAFEPAGPRGWAQHREVVDAAGQQRGSRPPRRRPHQQLDTGP
jgi:hypothetical protein